MMMMMMIMKTSLAQNITKKPNKQTNIYVHKYTNGKFVVMNK